MIHRQYPSTTLDTGQLLVNDTHALSSLLRDILHSAQTPEGKEGRKFRFDAERGAQDLTTLRDENYATLPFHEAFRVLARDRSSGRDHSRTEIARKTGLSRSRVHRLLTRAETPSLHDLETIAVAYRKPTAYFCEYRAEFIAQHLTARLQENPEMSQAMYRKIVGS